MTRGRLLLPGTIVATFWLFLLGIYTAAIGAGLTCGARWPLCDGAVFGLFPANWTSFVEWFHRLVALVTGFMILGSWWVVWRGKTERRAVAAMSVAVVLLPVQIWLGAQTVIRYELLYLTAHFLTPLVIFASLIAGVWWWAGLRLSRFVRRVLVGGLSVAFLLFVVLTPQFLAVHSGTVQVLYYGIGLLIFASLSAIGLDALDRADRGTAVIAAAGLVVLAVQLLAGRLVRSSTVHTIDWLAAGVFVLVLAGILRFTLSSDTPSSIAAS